MSGICLVAYDEKDNHMIRRLLPITILGVLSAGNVKGESLHTRARELFFLAGETPCRAAELIDLTLQDSSARQVVYAYRGAAFTMMADCVRSPLKKLKNFNRGRDIIEEAVRRDPSDPEIRFIRFMVQNGAPSFLDYDNREEDLAVLMDAIQGNPDAGPGREFLVEMLKAIISTKFPGKEERKKIAEFIKQQT
jgi:hypothetical protein